MTNGIEGFWQAAVAVRSDLAITAEHEAWIQNYVRNTNAGLPLVDRKENSHSAFLLILALLEKQDRHFMVMCTCWSVMTNWIHYISYFSPSFIHTVLLISGTGDVENELRFFFFVKYFRSW